MLPKADIDAVLAALENARPFPGRAYADREVFTFEEDEILARSWLCAGREEDVALSGQWMRSRIARESVLVVRGPELKRATAPLERVAVGMGGAKLLRRREKRQPGPRRLLRCRPVLRKHRRTSAAFLQQFGQPTV